MDLRSKHLLVWVGVIVTLTLALGGLFWKVFWTPHVQATARRDRPVLRVDRRLVDANEFREAQNRFFMEHRRDSYMLHLNDAERNDLLVEELIARIALEEYLKQRVKIDNAAVNEYLNRYLKVKYAKTEELQEYLERIHCKEADLPAMISLYLAKLQLFTKLAKQAAITVSPADIDREFERQKAANRKAVIAHITIFKQGRTPQAAAELARKVYQQLRQGADFAALARQYSDDALTKESGGALGPLEREAMAPQVRKRIFSVRPGQLLPLVDTRQSWEIVKLVRVVEYFHPRDEVTAMLLMQKFAASPHYQKWLKRVKATMKIVVLDPALKAYRCFKARKYRAAASLYERLYRSKGRESDLRRALESYYLAHKWDRVVKLGKDGLRKFQAKVPYYLAAAEGLYHQKRVKKALQMLKQAEKAASDSLMLRQMVAKIYTKLGLEKN
jgi:parvulin-like peptidyl-prolyl isomerase